HGCTTGQLDNEQLFYLRARGISEDKARAMLLHAFAGDVIANISVEPVREYLEQLITDKIEN
ncbi:MAG: SufD family Fe-S cluster assembly protein, partial [Imperialibacter sp.]